MNENTLTERGRDRTDTPRTPRDIDRFEDEGGPGPEDTRGRRRDAPPTAVTIVTGPGPAPVGSPREAPPGPARPRGGGPRAAGGRLPMASEFRERLQRRIGAADGRGRPAAGVPEVIGVECELGIDQLRAIQPLMGRCNDAPFCGAGPGRLTLLGRVRHGGAAPGASGRYPVTVQFAYAAPPLGAFVPADGMSRPASPGPPGPGGTPRADFGVVLP